MDISGLDKAKVLAALFNVAKPQGFGFSSYDQKPMTAEEAQKLLDDGIDSFDYLKGRAMKIGLGKDEVDTQDFNRVNGPDAAERTIDELRRTGEVNPPAIAAMHKAATQESARLTRAQIERDRGRSGVSFAVDSDGTRHAKLGFGDVADELGQIIDKVSK